MGETTRQIAMHIEHTREDLGANLQELEHKVKSVADWRQQFRNNPMMMVGLAFGGGVFLATVMSGSRNRLAGMSSGDARTAVSPQFVAGRQRQQVTEAWENIKCALVGVAASRVKSFLGETIPGFGEHLRRAETERRDGPRGVGVSGAGVGVSSV
jgi:hypothetical protein